MSLKEEVVFLPDQICLTFADIFANHRLHFDQLVLKKFFSCERLLLKK